MLIWQTWEHYNEADSILVFKKLLWRYGNNELQVNNFLKIQNRRQTKNTAVSVYKI